MGTPKEGAVTWRVRINELPQHYHRGDSLAELVRLGDGRLLFSVAYADKTRLEFESEPVRITSNQRVEILANWIEPVVVLEINGEVLDPYVPGRPPREITLPEPPPLGPTALDHPDRLARCQRWIDERQSYFATAPRRGANRRPKDIDEQCDDLRTAIASIEELLTGIEGGKLFLAAYLAGTLRALVCWADSPRARPTYNALLLRIANVGSLPLPVWAVADPIPEPCTVDHPACVSGNFAHLLQAEADEDLMDLQEWLNTTVVALWDAAAGEERRVSVRDLIAEISNTLGGSHYDPDTSVFGETLMKVGSGNTSYWLKFLGGCADIVSAYSKWVLDELHQVGAIRRGSR